MALIHRYMIDAEEAGPFAQAAAGKDEAPTREEALAVAVREQEDRRGEPAFAGTATPTPELDPSEAEGTLQNAPATVPKGGSPTVQEAPGPNGRPDPRKELQVRKALVKAEERAAKQAARRMAALEKKEARERKALAKAAARRRTA